MINFYVIDTETTGVNVNLNEIFQISIVRLSDNCIHTNNIAVENPERASYEALRVTGRTKKDISTGINFRKSVELCSKFFEEDNATPEGRCIIAHNAKFDHKFCHAMWKKAGKQFPANLWICTMKYMKEYAKHEGIEKIAQIQQEKKAKYSLDASLKAFKNIDENIKILHGAHSATIDAINTGTLFNLLKSKIEYLNLIETKPHVLEKNVSRDVEFIDYE